MALGLGLNTGVLALPEVGALEESLSTAEAAIVHAEAELKLTLTSHDADEIRAAGTRLREIKQRRLVILRDLESARAERDRLEAAEALGRRPALMRRLEELQGEPNEAAAA